MSYVQVSSPPESLTVTDKAEAEQPAVVAEGLGRPGAHTNGMSQHAVDVDAQQADVSKVLSITVPSLG